MNVFALGLQVGETLQWIVDNWVAIFSMLAMLAFILLLVVLALAPDARMDGDVPDDSRGERSRRGADRNIES